MTERLPTPVLHDLMAKAQNDVIASLMRVADLAPHDADTFAICMAGAFTSIGSAIASAIRIKPDITKEELSAMIIVTVANTIDPAIDRIFEKRREEAHDRSDH
jgi:hypothetical protein